MVYVWYTCVKGSVTQPCPTVCGPMDCSSPGSSVHGLLQARIPGASLVARMAKHLPPMQETQVQSLGWEDPLEKGMATHSSVLAWRMPWTQELVGCSPQVTEAYRTAQLTLLHSRTLQWVAISFFRGSSRLRDWTRVSSTAGRFFTIWATREALIHMYRHKQNSLYNSSPNKGKSSLFFFSRVTANTCLPRALLHVKRAIVTTPNKIKNKTNAHVIKLK